MTDKKQIQIRIPDTLKTGVYANAVSITINEGEVVLDMGYLLPNVQPAQIDVVSRVNMSHATAEKFLTLLQNSILDHRKKTSKTSSTT